MELFLAKTVLDLLDFGDRVLDRIERWAYSLVGVEFDSDEVTADIITTKWEEI